MNYSLAGTVCKVSAVCAAICGIIPGALLLNRRITLVEQSELAFSTARQLECALVAVAGFVVGYLLFRVGIYLKMKSHDPKSEPNI